MDKYVVDLEKFLKESYAPEEKIKQDRKGGTTQFFRKGGKPLCYLYSINGKSTVTLVIGASLEEKVRLADISSEAKEKFVQAKQYHDGRWLLFDLATKDDLEDIKKLLLIKKTPKEK